MLNLGIKLTELGLIPESILRIAIKKLLKQMVLFEGDERLLIKGHPQNSG